ncbi:MBL fold metallo-hydrolase [Aeoliella sp.]|uniref:MBL fold metallo-hydrolase n=1 Tax=Aeoliella sp. TaxID=2795800 RepID=UPI003CCBE146
MQITQIRNATILLEVGDRRILVDPMLSPPSSLPGFRLFRGDRRKNPLTTLPEGIDGVLSSATDVLITHEHPDHFDQPALAWVASRNLRVWASSVDVANLQRKGLDARDVIDDECGLPVEVIPGTHGHGVLGWLMGPVAGFYLACPGEPTVYLTGDTVLTRSVQDTIERLQPHVVVAPAGVANFGIGKDLLFSEAELVELARQAPGRIVFNHLESIDHCPMTSARLRKLVEDAGVGEKVVIPGDGERLSFSLDTEVPHVSPGDSKRRRPSLQKWVTAKMAGT